MKAIQLTVGQVLKAKNDIWPQAPAKEYTIIQVAEEIDPQMYKEGLRGLAWAKDNETDELAALTVCEDLGILVKNTNKRILDSYPLYNKDGDSEEPYTITILLKRIKRVLNMFKNIYSFYCMLKFFKYPVISSIFWIVLLYYTFLCDPKFYMTHWIVFIISILFYYSSVFQNYLYPKLKPILFYIRNKYDNPSKLAVTESQKNKAEVAQSKGI